MNKLRFKSLTGLMRHLDENVNSPHHKIAIYLYDIKNRNVGLGEFAYQLGSYISKRAKELREKYNIVMYFIVPVGYVGCFGDDVEYFEFTEFNRRVSLRYLKKGFDLCHHIHQFSRLRFMRRAKVNFMTVHDINFMYEKSGDKLEWYKARFARSLSRCSEVTYISNFVKKDVEAHFSPRCNGDVIYNGVADLSDVTGDFSKFGLEDNSYLFHISSLMPKKNVHKIVEMMRYLPEEKLLVVGNLNSEYARCIKKQIAEWGLENVIMLNHVSNEDKAELYRHCKAFLFPSLCEGFGLPPIEAMHFGKPVFLSKLTSLPEVGGDCAYYYNSLDPEAMADVTRKGLADFYADAEAKAVKLRERAASFNWKECADAYIEEYLRILGIKK